MLIFILIAISFSIYSLWDIKTVIQSASAEAYAQYKPDGNQPTFEELKKINPEVVGWITVYGTGIDYPVVQGEDNERYLTTDSMGEYSLSGAIFLDYRNAQNFLDFNSIIYGHNMAYSAMFGDIKKFQGKDFFMAHKYGHLCADGKNFGIEIAGFLKEDAYKSHLYAPGVTGDTQKRTYIKGITDHAIVCSQGGITPDDRIVVMSTCTAAMTNGRYVLIGKLSEEPFEDPFQRQTGTLSGSDAVEYDYIIRILLILLILLLFLFFRALLRWRYSQKWR